MKISKIKIIIYILFLIGVGVWYSFYKNNTLHTVTLETKGPAYTIYLSTDKNKVVATVTSKAVLRLSDGYYCGSTTDNKYEAAMTCFAVYKKDMTFTFNPNYSKKHLSELLVSEKNVISDVISKKYPTIIGDFTVCGGELYRGGDIYGTALIRKTAFPRDNADIYRILLEKIDNKWSVVKNPEIVLDKNTYSDIPVDILIAIDTLPTC